MSLLLASRFPTLINAVAAYVPSAVIHGTLRAGAPGEKPDSPAWTWEGKPLTNVWYQNLTADWSAFLAKNRTNSTPVRQAPSFVSAQNDQQAVDRARILVENIQGPIAFIAGTDDGFWPSVGYTRSMVQTLNTHQHPWPILELIETGAGHAIGIPFTPATQIAKQHPVAKILLTGGGSAATNAKASENSWPQVIQFLASAAKNKELSQ